MYCTVKEIKDSVKFELVERATSEYIKQEATEEKNLKKQKI